MARLGVKNNLLFWLTILKPLNINNSCTVRLTCEKFSIDMNLTYLINKRHSRFASFMGIRSHGIQINIRTENNQLNVSHTLHHRGFKWYEYTDNRIFTRVKAIQIFTTHQLLTTPIQVYGFRYIVYNNSAELTMTKDLVNYRHVRYGDRAPLILSVINSRYGEIYTNKDIEFAQKPTFEDMMKLLLE